MDVRIELREFLRSKEALVYVMMRTFRGGVAAEDVAAAVAPAFGRDQVTRFLAAVALCDRADAALRGAGLGEAVEVWVPGVDGPHEVRMRVCVDPQEAPGFGSLPGRVRRALYGVGISVVFTRSSGWHGVPAERFDEAFADVEFVRLVMVAPPH